MEEADTEPADDLNIGLCVYFCIENGMRIINWGLLTAGTTITFSRRPLLHGGR